MRRGFQFWPQNYIRITFDPLFCKKKTVENSLNRVFANFRRFLGRRWGQMLSDLNFEARFGILSPFSIS